MSLGLVLRRICLPSKEERESFFAQFGSQHCFIVESRIRGFKVLSSSGTERVSFESLPADYLYAPDNWGHRITDNQLRNVLLSLRHLPNDFVIVSASLAQFPSVAVSSIRNHTIFSKELGLEFPEGQGKEEATGKILRLLPYDHAVTQMNVEELFREHSVTWTPDPCWPPRDPLLSIEARRIRPIDPTTESILELNAQVICKRDAGAPVAPTTGFIPTFNKQKPLVFVWPMAGVAVFGQNRPNVAVELDVVCIRGAAQGHRKTRHCHLHGKQNAGTAEHHKVVK